MGLAGTAHQQAAEELGVPFIAGNALSRPSEFPSLPLHIVNYERNRVVRGPRL